MLFFSFSTVLTRSEFSGRAAAALLTFSDSLAPDSLSLSGFSPLLRLPTLQQRKGVIPRPDAKDKIARLAANDYGNLYV